jgi:hypothetical protein
MEESALGRVREQEVIDPPAQRGIPGAGPVKVSGPLRGWQPAGGAEDGGFQVGGIVHERF